jgi:hypothetical protein
VLVVLVALMGWEHVVDEVREVDTRPADIEALTGIHGGTLRPTLKKLKDAHLIASVDGHYSATCTMKERRRERVNWRRGSQEATGCLRR